MLVGSTWSLGNEFGRRVGLARGQKNANIQSTDLFGLRELHEGVVGRQHYRERWW